MELKGTPQPIQQIQVEKIDEGERWLILGVVVQG
jgi:hypothetical protein